jgi:uronate dehydrogenase
MKRILITGAAGRIGKVLSTGLNDSNLFLRLCDINPITPDNAANQEAIQLDIQDLTNLEIAMQDIDCVIHMAGIAHEDNWNNILSANITGTYNVFEAARRTGVKRVIFASSNHAVGFYKKQQTLTSDVPPRPDSLYGVSKVFGEALGRFYADKHGLSVACLRIGSFMEKPTQPRHLRTWVSHQDMVQLVRSCIDAPNYHYVTLYGVSANTQSNWENTLEGQSIAETLKFYPQDNAELFANEIEFRQETDDKIADEFHGGAMCSNNFMDDSTASNNFK